MVLTIAITGMPGSGKSVAVNVLSERGIPVVVMRHIIEEDLNAKGIEITNKTLREYATAQREEHGFDIVAKRCIPRILELRERGNDVVVLDGVRGLSEVKLFKKELPGDFLVIAILAPANLRLGRLRERGEKWDMTDESEFNWRDEKELAWGLGAVISLADHFVLNMGTLEDCNKEIGILLDGILDH